MALSGAELKRRALAWDFTAAQVYSSETTPQSDQTASHVFVVSAAGLVRCSEDSQAVNYKAEEPPWQVTTQALLFTGGHSYLNLPIFLRWENISPPGTYSNTMYKLELSWKVEEIYTVSYGFLTTIDPWKYFGIGGV